MRPRLGLVFRRGLASSPSPPSPPAPKPLPSKLAAYAVPARFAAYAPRLHRLSSRTGVPLPSLALSFLVLHELTALVPVLGLFYAFHAAGAGQAIVSWVREAGSEEHGWQGWVKGWYDEGERRVEKVGRRYGLLGYEKGSALNDEKASKAGAVADAIAAYVVVKALLPARIGLSIAAAPAFARWTLLPLQRLIRRGR
ncbi:hypothetical protein Q5752_002616 [Cryptotrichosporon argae]